MSPEEVAHLIDSSQTWFHRIVLMTLYGTGVRRAELTRGQIPDINSRRMVIHIRGGKGRQDRDVMLSPTLLKALRDYWRGLKRKPTEWLFPGGSRHTSNRKSANGLYQTDAVCILNGGSFRVLSGIDKEASLRNLGRAV